MTTQPAGPSPLTHRNATAAAFFDLDKTILAKSSSLMFARPFYRNGLIGRADVLRSAYAQFVFLGSGADHDQIEQLRNYLSALCKGWPVDQVTAIVNETLDELVEPTIYEEALALIDEHHAAGRDVIIVSSSGTEIVEPIGVRLGVDLAVGSQLAVEDGRYTGEILFYAYGPAKAEAIRELAAEHGYDLSQCYAYSDSQTDVPMLECVGYPFAVNPDTELRRTAAARSWPVLDFARPTTMRPRPRGDQAAAAAAAIGAVALGVAWYAARRRDWA